MPRQRKNPARKSSRLWNDYEFVYSHDALVLLDLTAERTVAVYLEDDLEIGVAKGSEMYISDVETLYLLAGRYDGHYTVEMARAVFMRMASREACEQIEFMEKGENCRVPGEWVKDPEVKGTFGFVAPGTRMAYVVVYSPELPWQNGKWDFEIGVELENLILS